LHPEVFTRGLLTTLAVFRQAEAITMKRPKRLLIALATFLLGVLAAAVWSNYLGRRVWSPRVFTWRNPLRQPPKIDLASDCPLLISNPRYYSFAAIGSSVGGELRFDITNRSNNLVHSYNFRYYSPVRWGNGGYGSHPEGGLLPEQSHQNAISAHQYAPLTLTIDFVQFANGDTWFSNSPHSNIKPEGVTRGARAAAGYLLQVLDSGGVSKVMDALPRIHVDVWEPYGGAQSRDNLDFGFYNGVTNIVVRVEHEYKNGGDARVEAFLRSYGH
jgi:hypothetical protein